MKWFKSLQKSHLECDYEDMIIEKTTVYYIPCERIRSNAMRSRSDFNEDKLIALAYSIKRYGIIEPLCVRKTDIGDSYDYEIIAGERRLRAAKLLGLNVAPCIIYDVPPEISAEMSLAENISHVPLDYFEEAFALRRLVDTYEGSFENLAARLYMSDAELSEKLELLELDFAERQTVLKCNLSEEDASKLSQISDKVLRTALIRGIESGTGSFDAASESDVNFNGFARNSLPRDISSVVFGIRKRINFLNRHTKRAKMDIVRRDNVMEIKIEIRV